MDDADIFQFIERTYDQGFVWGLVDKNEEWALVESTKYDNIFVMPFWSSNEIPKKVCTGEWAEYKPHQIAIETFLDDWLVGMHSDVFLAGLDWSESLDGVEYEPLDLLEYFEMNKEGFYLRVES